ncbi:hypothetical protein ACWIFB_08055 [Dietzia sp. NPDC055340]
MSDTSEKNLHTLTIVGGFVPWIGFALVAQRLAGSAGARRSVGRTWSSRRCGGIAIIAMGAASLFVTALDDQAASTNDPHLLDFLLNWVVPVAVIRLMIHVTNTYADPAGRRARRARPKGGSTDHVGEFRGGRMRDRVEDLRVVGGSRRRLSPRGSRRR